MYNNYIQGFLLESKIIRPCPLNFALIIKKYLLITEKLSTPPPPPSMTHKIPNPIPGLTNLQ